MLSRTASLYRSSFSGLSREIWLLSLAILINRCGMMVIPFMTLYLTSHQMGYTLTDAGVVMGLFGTGSIAGSYLGGWLTDRIGFQKVQAWTLLCGGLMFIILGQVNSFPLICALAFVLAAVNDAFRPANSSAIAHYSNDNNRTRSTSLNRLAINLGWAVGTTIGGFLAATDYKLLFWVDGLSNIAAASVLIFALKPVVYEHLSKMKTAAVKALSPYRDKTYLWFILFITLYFIAFFHLFSVIPKYWRDDLHMSESFIGILMAINGLLIVLVEMVLVYKMEGRRSYLYFIAAGAFLCALGFVAPFLPINATLQTLILVLFITIGEIISFPFMVSYWISRSSPATRGQYAALYTMTWGVAQAAGPFVGSIVADHFGFQPLFAMLFALLMLSAAGFAWLNRA